MASPFRSAMLAAASALGASTTNTVKFVQVFKRARRGTAGLNPFDTTEVTSTTRPRGDSKIWVTILAWKIF